MKKMFKLLITLTILYFIGIQIYLFFKTHHAVSYSIVDNDKTYNIEEVFSYNKLGNDGYYIKVSFDDYNIPVRLYGKYYKQKNIVTNVKTFYGDIYTCVNIAVKGNFNITDIKCIKDDVVYFYSNIKGEDALLDSQINSSSYNHSLFVGNTNASAKDNISYYVDNFVDKINVLVADYKGAYLFGKNVTNNSRFIKLFEQDKYTKPLETTASKYYIVADYNSSHDFTYFNIVNMITGVSADIQLNNPISFNSYIQGVVGESMYIIDKDSKEQHEINLKTKSDTEVGNISTGAKMYINGEWTTKNINFVIDNNEVFETEKPVVLENLLYLNKIGEDNSITYGYLPSLDGYDVYVIYKDGVKNFAFKTTNIEKLLYKDGYVFYINDESIYAFRDDFGSKKIVTYSELKYNKGLNYFVY